MKLLNSLHPITRLVAAGALIVLIAALGSFLPDNNWDSQALLDYLASPVFLLTIFILVLPLFFYRESIVLLLYIVVLTLGMYTVFSLLLLAAVAANFADGPLPIADYLFAVMPIVSFVPFIYLVNRYGKKTSKLPEQYVVTAAYVISWVLVALPFLMLALY